MFGKILFLIFIHTSLQASKPADKTYNAAVVELNFGLTSKLEPTEKSEKQFEQYVELLNKIEPSTLDIIVFPEMTLNEMETAVEVPEIDDKISPCNDNKYEGLVNKLSCLALTQASYLVVNIVTKAKCPDPEMIRNNDPRKCEDREDGFSYYNTNVVFDRTGTVVSRYRKFNLFGEVVDKPNKPDMVTFKTDFGVTFGTFICFDLMFRYPAVELVRSHNVTDLIFPTMWFSEAPFLTAVQAQQNWAHSLNVNLLAAGANFPAIGSTGTGIYGGNKGAYVMEMGGSNKSSIYIASVYKKIPENEDVKLEHKINRYEKAVMKDLNLKTEKELLTYDLTFLEDTDGPHFSEKHECRDGFCCSIKVNYTVQNSATKKHYQYVMAFNHGKRSFDSFADGGHVACAILACHSKNISSCGVRDETLEHIHSWRSVEISGKFPTKDGQFLYMPTSLDASILPLQPQEFKYEVEHEGDEDEISIELENKEVDLLTFGIYGRDFNLDNGAPTMTISLALLLFSIFSVFKLW